MSMESEVENCLFELLMSKDGNDVWQLPIDEVRSLMKEAYRMGVESKEAELNKTLEDLFDVEAAKNG
jgi:hypothetical protein